MVLYRLDKTALACAVVLAAAHHPSRITAEEHGGTFRVTIERRWGLPCGDCDGIAAGDISGNGKLDILASNGKGGTAFWFEQGGSPWEWRRHTIFAIEDRPREIEGNALGDFNGDGRLEAVSLDQPNGTIYLHQQGEDPRGPWPTAALRRDRPFLQDALVADIDGDGRDDLVYTWEGDAAGRGGVHWLKLTGTDPLEPSHWTDHAMVTHESAWWLAPRRADLSGDGRAADVVFTARNMPGRNPATKPGLFWLETPPDVAGPWRLHAIDRTVDHPLQVDWGDFSGEGHGLDLAVAPRGTDHIHWYQRSRSWQRHDVPLPELSSGVRPRSVWNIKAFPYGGPRDGILAPIMGGNRGALVLFEFVGGAYRANELLEIDYGHPMDDRILLADLDGDGRLEALIPDSGTGVDRLWIIKFAVPLPCATEQRTEWGKGS